MLIPRIAFLPKKLFSQEMHIPQIRFFRDKHIGQIPFLRLSRWDTNSALERSGAVLSRREAAWWQQGFDREGGGVPISLAAAFRLERRWAPLKLVGITSSKKGDVRLLRLAAAPRVVVVMDLLGRRE